MIPTFWRSLQVGPLLDWVASLRICIGYPDALLVERARYLNRKKHLLPPETRKFFDYIVVDEVFEWKRMTDKNSSSVMNVGTMRTPSCRFVAGDFADICEGCRLLQEPLEFLSVKKSWRKRTKKTLDEKLILWSVSNKRHFDYLFFFISFDTFPFRFRVHYRLKSEIM